jgi:Holliday junction DNA helicase RuvA
VIASLNGTVQEVTHDGVVVEVGGAGLHVFTPAPLRDGLRVGERLILYTQLIVRQDLLALYGFETREARQFFNLLLGVDGIGPRLALAVLSTLSIDAMRRAVFHEQAEVFSRVPGVGKRTAQKILLYLQDRVPGEAGLERVAAISDVDGEVIAALTALGYSVVEAQSALQALPKDAPDVVEEKLRLALQYIGR